jgi:hypothetical protein
MSESFTHITLPHVHKRVLRIGIAGNYGLDEGDLLHAADRGAGLWLYNSKFKHVTRALNRILPGQRDQHVVATLGIVAYTGAMVRRLAEDTLRLLQIDELDVLLLPWLGRASLLTSGIRDTLVRLKEEAKVRAARDGRISPSAAQARSKASDQRVRTSFLGGPAPRALA